MFQGNMYHLNVFGTALFTSNVGFKHVSCKPCIIYVQFMLCHWTRIVAMVSQIFCFPPVADNWHCISSSVHISTKHFAFIISPILVLLVSRLLSAFIHHYERVWFDHDWNYLARMFQSWSEQSCFNHDSRNALSNVNTSQRNMFHSWSD